MNRPVHARGVLAYSCLGILWVAPFARGADCNRNGIDDGKDIAPGDYALEAPRALEMPLGATVLWTPDLDGDGTQDLVAVGYLGVCIRLAVPGGGFGPLQAIDVSGAPVSAAAADLDADGDVDIVTAGEGNGQDALGIDEIATLLNNGTGALQGPGYLDAVPGPVAVDVADLDGDGRVDILVAGGGIHTEDGDDNVVRSEDGNLSILPGTGPGNFAQPRLLEPGAHNIAIAADLDGDGDADLITSANLGIASRANDGAGNFAAAVEHATGGIASGVVATDIDGDGRLDLAFTNAQFGDFSVLWNEGGGRLGDVVHYAVGLGAGAFALLDMDGDGRRDAVIGRSYDKAHALVVLLQSVARVFGKAVEVEDIYVGESIAPADFDRDGDLDFVLAQASVSLLERSGPLSFVASHTFPIGTWARDVLSADLDADGRVDLVVPSETTNLLSVLLGTGGGAFRPPVAQGTGTGPQSVVRADLDRDGDLDLAVACLGRYDGSAYRDSSVEVHWNRGDGTFVERTSLQGGVSPFDLVAADLNADGDDDLAVAHMGRWDGKAYHDSGVAVLRNLGAHAFAPPAESEAGPGLNWIVAADLDRDGDGDLALSHQGVYTGGTYLGQGISLLFGRGDGSFGTAVELEAGSSPHAVTAADFDGDQDIDLVVNQYSSVDPGDSVQVLRNKGHGAFGGFATFRAGESPYVMAAGDMDGDGAADLVAASRVGITVLRGSGDGTLLPPAGFGVLGGTIAVTLDDFDGDERLDAAAVSFYEERGAVLLNRTRPPASLDHDRDGVPDECESAPFHRGDANADGAMNVTDAVFTLEYLFRGGADPPCRESSDVQNDGRVDLSDAISILDFLFRGGARPALPGPPGAACGADPDRPGSADDLGCREYARC